MAFQRPFLISLKRGDSSMRWGFGINGGSEYGQPLRIHSVAEDSIAEHCGLHEGDEIIQVGRVNVQDLTQGQAYELLARCGNKIEMFVVREDWLSQKKGKDPPVVKTVVHNPYNSPLSLYSTANVAETLARQTEVLTGHISAEEEEGPENLSFREKSAVFKLLEEQANQEGPQRNHSKGSPHSQVVKPKVAPPPPPKPHSPASDHLYNGYDSQQLYQDQHKSKSRIEYQTAQKVVNQQEYRQEQPIQYTQTSVYQTSSIQNPLSHQSTVAVEKSYSPEYQSPGRHQQIYQQSSYQQVQGPQSPGVNYQQRNQQQSYQQTHYQQGPHSPVTNYPQKSQQQLYQQSNYQQQVQGSQSPVAGSYQQHPGYHSPSAATHQPLSQVHNQQVQHQQNREFQQRQASSQQSQVQHQGVQQSARGQQSPTVVSKAEFKIGPTPPPRGSSTKQQDSESMAAIYRQQYEHHLQQQFEQQQMQANLVNGVGAAPKAHIIKDNIFENDSSSVTPITYKAPPAAPPKPNWPPPPSSEQLRAPPSPNGMRVGSVWPPKKSAVTELPRTGFNPAAVREQGTGRKCVWPPPGEEYRSGRNTPQSPVGGRKIQWNPSPSPPMNRRAVFGASQSPVRRKDIQWPPPAAMHISNKENYNQQSPRLSRRARFDDYIKEHASINVPQTYRPPPGTQHVEFY